MLKLLKDGFFLEFVCMEPKSFRTFNWWMFVFGGDPGISTEMVNNS